MVNRLWQLMQPAQAVRADPESIGVLLHWVTVLIGLITAVISIVVFATQSVGPGSFVLLGLVFFAVAVTQVAIRRGQAERAAGVFLVLLWGLISLRAFTRGGLNAPVLGAYFPILAASSVLLGRRFTLLFALLSTATVSVLAWAGAAGWTDLGAPYTATLRLAILAGSLLMTGAVIFLSARLKESAADRARAHASLYAELFQAAPESLLSVHSRGTVEAVNRAALRLFALEVEQVVGRPVNELPGLGLLTLQQGQADSSTVTRADGTRRHVELEVSALPLGDFDGYRVALRDVTSELEAAAARDRLQAQLNQSQKMESIGLLAGGIAHDFNNLVTAILGNLELLRQPESQSQAPQLLGDIEQASLRAADLTRQLLAFSRRQVLQPKNLSVSDVVLGPKSMLRRLLPESLELRFALDAAGTVRADAGQLEQVVVNLAVNARDAMPQGGTLCISTRDVRTAPGHDSARAPYVSLTLSDTGQGMDAAVAARIFEPFFTTKPVGQGTGLGLSVVDGIVRQSGGTITVEASPGQGATFEVLLPCVDAPAEPTGDAAARLARGNACANVLLVEDEPALRRVVALVLEEAGHLVTSAEDGDEALRLAAERTTPLDLVVTDVVMPRLGGEEVVRQLRLRYPDVRVLFLSGYTNATLEELGATDDKSAFLGKPFRPASLVAAVEALLGRRASVTPSSSAGPRSVE